MLAAASTKVMDALFGFPARNDVECCKRELLGRSWRRDWGMRKSRPKNAFLGTGKNYGDWMLGVPGPKGTQNQVRCATVRRGARGAQLKSQTSILLQTRRYERP